MALTHEGLLRERVRNRYKNALHYVDGVAGGMLDALEKSGALENTIVLITGDHGEEFAENGHWGHTSNFAPEQVAVPLLLRGPGIARGIETRPTSHVDVAGWGELGLWTADGIFRVPLAADRPLELAAYDSRWCLLQDQDRVIARQAAALAELSRACGKFLDLGAAPVERGSQ